MFATIRHENHTKRVDTLHGVRVRHALRKNERRQGEPDACIHQFTADLWCVSVCACLLACLPGCLACLYQPYQPARSLACLHIRRRVVYADPVAERKGSKRKEAKNRERVKKSRRLRERTSMGESGHASHKIYRATTLPRFNPHPHFFS